MDGGEEAGGVGADQAERPPGCGAPRPRPPDAPLAADEGDSCSETGGEEAEQRRPSTKYSEEWEDELLRRKKKTEQEARRAIKAAKPLPYPNCHSVEDCSKVFVKESILHAESAYELLQRAELLIDHDWLAATDELPGNIYRMNAFTEFVPRDKATSFVEKLSARARQTGFVMIALIQLFGPPLVFFQTLGFGVSEDQRYHFEELGGADLLHDWKQIPSTKALGLVFVFAFCLNACYVTMYEEETFRKIYKTFGYLKVSTPHFDMPGTQTLFAGAFIDCWVVLWCCVDAFLIIGAAQSPKDLLMDALGLVFLYNLDDIGGTFGFVDDDDWPGERLAWVFDEMVESEYKLQDFAEQVEAQGMACLPPVELATYLYRATALLCAFLSVAETILGVICPFLLIT